MGWVLIIVKNNFFRFGAKYAYNETSKTFEFYHGDDMGPIEVDYPKTVYLSDGHPEVFSANGSHGTWALPGK